MAKQRAVIIEDGEDADAQTRQEAELEQANEDTDGELLRSLQEMAGTAGVTFLFTRTYPNTPDALGFCGEMTPAEFTLDRVREVYGPGHYRVRVKGPKGFLPGGGTIRISKGPAAPPGTGGAGGASDVASFFKLLNEREETRRREDSEKKWKILELTIPGAITLLASVLGRTPQGPDLAGLITALKPAPAAPAPSIAELTASLASLKTLTDRPEGGDKFDTILKVLEFAKTMSGEGNGDKGSSNWIDLIRDLVKEGPAMVQPLLENLRAQREHANLSTAPAMSVAPIPISSGSTAPTSPAVAATSVPPLSMPDVTTATGDDMLAFAMPIIRAQLAKLLSWAQENKRVELYAEVLLEELPALVHSYVTPEKALEYLEDSRWFDVVKQYEPRLAPYGEWLESMRLEIVEIIRDQLKDAKTIESEEEPE